MTTPFRGAGLPGGGAQASDRLGRVRFRDARGRYVKGPGGTVYDEIGPRLIIAPLVTETSIAARLEFYRDQVEQWMRDNAPWNDVDTPHSYAGEARDGLTASVSRDGLSFALHVYHTVDYGIWLEVRWSGKYAILRPTVEEWGPHVIADMEVFA